MKVASVEAAGRKTLTPHEQATAQKFLKSHLRAKRQTSYSLLSRPDGNAITGEGILDVIESNLVIALAA
jgi:hypothetical protein